jgi:hypothetical protein
MLTALLLTVCSGVNADEPARAELPAKKELFAREEFYRNQEGKEETFIGTLRKSDRGKGVVGFGRFNPFRLEMNVNGKADVREVYSGGKSELLDPYVGKRVKLTGKAVNMEVEGRNHREIWPARLEVLPDNKKADPSESPAREAPVKEGTQLPLVAGAAAEPAGKAVKVLAETAAPPVAPKDGKPLVIRNAKELMQAQGGKGDEEAATAALAKALKVDGIDWNKQMVLVLSGGQRRTGGYSVQVKGIEVKGDTLTVRWEVKGPPPGSFVTQALTHPSKTLLVERFDGTIRFDPPQAEGGGGTGRRPPVEKR